MKDVTLKRIQTIALNRYTVCGDGSQTGAGAWVVLIFWPNFRLAVLIEVVLIKKKRVSPLRPKTRSVV